MNGWEALEELKNVEVFEEDDSWCGGTWYYPLQSEKYEENFNIIEHELKVNQALKEKLDYNTMFRALPYDVARQVADYLTQNEDIKKWLKEE